MIRIKIGNQISEMKLKEIQSTINSLANELALLRPISFQMEKRIMEKFRLEWNFHSNHIEGNQLNYGETKALLLFGITAQGKPLKDHLEIQGHNEAIKYIEEVVKQGRPLTENFIRELHTIILKESYQVDAITPDGKPTKKWVHVGKYKTEPNHVLTKTGETFYFSTPEETPAEMEKLIEWYRSALDKKSSNPSLIAFEFHYRFVRIHPFDDGNGRMARILMNFILMQNRLPPVIVETEKKDGYLSSLQQADADNIEVLFEYLGEQLIKSLRLMISGAKGENITEDDDLDKKIALLKKEIENDGNDNAIKIKLTPKVIIDILNGWGGDFFKRLAEKTAKFNDFYDQPKHSIILRIGTETISSQWIDKIDYSLLKERLLKNDIDAALFEASIIFRTSFGAYKANGLNAFGCNYTTEVKFDQYNYEIHIGYFDPKVKGQATKLYTKRVLHQPVTATEIGEVGTEWGEMLFEHLNYYRDHSE